MGLDGDLAVGVVERVRAEHSEVGDLATDHGWCGIHAESSSSFDGVRVA